jgi:hypothetical protein
MVQTSLALLLLLVVVVPLYGQTGNAQSLPLPGIEELYRLDRLPAASLYFSITDLIRT